MDIAVRLKDVYKEYPFYQHITAGFKSFLLHLPRNISLSKRKNFTALNGISIEIEKGETFGIIGRNGSGKSTILSLIAGVIRQNRGVVKIDGKISSLLELGSGFHPDLSGIENIILNGILMGSTRERVLKKLDKIIEFSELEDFIYQPLRTYSSGMQMRLGFSVAVHIDPEILLVDEALSVGDFSFQEKSMKKMIAFKESGATVIMVSHDLSSISRLCNRTAWIEKGRIMATGETLEVIMKYIDHFELQTDQPAHEDKKAEGTEVQSVPDYLSDPQDNGGSGQAGEEPADYHVTLPPSVPSSWWDLPQIIDQCEVLITGSPEVSFHEFLKRQYIPGSLEKGLCICNRLKEMWANFKINNICRSFDVIDDDDRFAKMLSGETDLKNNNYDLFLCVDFLHRIKRLDPFLKGIDSALKDGGFIIALEYVGPADSQRSDKEMVIAGIIKSLINKDTVPDTSVLQKIYNSDVSNIKGMMSQNEVIPILERFFDILTVRYFGGPSYDLLFSETPGALDPNDRKDTGLIKTIIQFEQLLIKEGLLGNNYAMILAKKESAVA